MRKIFLLIGLTLGVIAAAGLIYFNLANQPVVSRIMVATRDIPAGELLNANDFRVARWGDVDQNALARYVTLERFRQYEGQRLLSDVRAGFPLGVVQLDPDTPVGLAARLSLAVTGTDRYYAVLPATPDDIGNWVQPNDRIDLLVTLGQFEMRELNMPLPPPTDLTVIDPAEASVPLSLTLMQPSTKLVLQNIRIVRIDRAKSEQRANVTRGSAYTGSAPVESASDEVRDVKRIYVEVSREQLEILTFLKRSGRHDFAVRGVSNEQQEASLGVSLTDYVRWFFAQRGNQDSANVDALSPAGPYEQRQRAGNTTP
jgi:Flp pilus assembly protein CpaB